MDQQKLLIVDDDESVRKLLRMRLSDSYEVIETGVPEDALGLALEHKPAAILLDLMMPKFSGFELCQNLHSLSYTSRTPIFIVSGESAERYREHCRGLGAKEFFEKPVDFAKLKARLAAELKEDRVERRAHVRVRLRVLIKLRGRDANGNAFEESTTTENVSAGGFLCTCNVSLTKETVVEVYVLSGQEQFAGHARVARREAPSAPWQRYGFEFTERTAAWVLQPK
jgi:DNA-binding response OmpR family regulator